MRRFRLLTDDYSNLAKGQIYPENCPIDDLERNVFDYFIMYPKDWQEVFDDQKPLHKDTDLGLFSAMILSEIGNNPNYKLVPKIKLVSESIDLAKELIKQLDKEKK